MPAFDLSRLLELSKGSCWGNQRGWPGLGWVSVDSRDVREGCLFVPLKGERSDGHLYLKEALEGGCRGAFVEREWGARHQETLATWARRYGALFFPVEDPLGALQALASFYRESLGEATFVGVTGSSGKTTMKEMIASILAELAPTYRSEGNLNSEIGLPLTLLRMEGAYKYVVLEMGVDHLGEMDILASIARPHRGIITNIGMAHADSLEDKEGIAREKRKICARMDEEGLCYVFEEEPLRDFLGESCPRGYQPYGPVHTEGFVGSESQGLKGQRLIFQEGEFLLPLPGEHNLHNALGAISLTRELGAQWSQIVRALEGMKSLQGRGEIHSGWVDIVEDCYNANPDSMKAAIEMVKKLPSRGRRILVLGDMLELGRESAAAHWELGSSLREKSFDKFFFYGPQMRQAWEALGSERAEVIYTDDYQCLEKTLGECLLEGDLVLLKASRRMALERL